MTPLSFLAELWRRRVDLLPNGAGLSYRAPEPLPPELREGLRGHKTELLKILVLMRRLEEGSRWLTRQHEAWLADEPGAVGDQPFGQALAAWEQLERDLRATGYPWCVFGPGQRCPLGAAATCDACQPELSRHQDYLRGQMSLEEYLEGM